MPQATCKYLSRVWITRVKQGLPRKKLVRLLGHKTACQLSRWERGSKLPSFHNALLLAAILKVPVEQLFTCLCLEGKNVAAACGSKPTVEEATTTRLLDKKSVADISIR